jgi:acyl-lipid omega-6 desaturase (Delta-12 desaturase)
MMNQHFPELKIPEVDLQAIARRIHRHCMGFRGADLKRSTTQILNTVPAFLVLCVVMGLLATNYYWASLLLAVPTAGFLLRIFIIQHDCGHGSFMPTRRGSDILGALLSVFTLTPYDHWKRSHAAHHAGSGNLDKRGFGDIETLTVAEYDALSRLGRLKYRIYRNLIVQLVIGAPVNFIIFQRWPSSYALRDRDAWFSVAYLNLAMVVFYGSLMWFFGPAVIFKVFLPVVTIAAWVGGWLFYVQHQFEDGVWDKADSWDFHVAALMGSSHYVLPRVLQWFTGNIGLHHIHHLCSGIPNYRLEECLKASPELQQIGIKLTIWESLKSIPLVLWHEGERRMISIREYHALATVKA